MSTQSTQAASTLDEALIGIRAVLADLAASAGDRDTHREHPEEGVRRLAQAGFGRLRVPQSHGGLGGDLPTLVELLAEAGAADANIPQIWRGHFTTIEILLAEPDRAVRDRWLTAIGDGAVFGNAQSEPAPPVSDSSAPSGGFTPTATRVTTDDEGHRWVSGRKFYSTGARFSDYIRASVVDEDGNDGFVVIPARHPGVTHVDDWDGIGQRLTGSGTTILSNVPVEPDGDIGRFQESMRGLDSFVQIVHHANLVGVARNLVTETVALVRARTRTNEHALGATASDDPEVLGVVGLLEVRRLTAEALLHLATARLAEAHASGSERDYEQAYIDTSAAQVGTIEAVLDAAARAFDAGGSSAIRSRAHLDRHWRNARTLASHNPVIYKPRIVGNHLVNGTAPVSGYYDGRSSQPEGAPTT